MSDTFVPPPFSYIHFLIPKTSYTFNKNILIFRVFIFAAGTVGFTSLLFVLVSLIQFGNYIEQRKGRILSSLDYFENKNKNKFG